MMDLNRENIDENLLLQYLLGNTSPEQQREIEEWLDKSGANRASLDRLEALWLETGKIDPAPVAVDVEAAWKRVSRRISRDDEKTSLQRKGKIIQVKWLKYALSAAAVALVLIGIYSLFRIIVKPVPEKILTSSDKVVSDTLPDGSRITLNKGSKLVYPEKFKGKTREVKLTGEAFFDVRHDAEQPFVVNAGIAKVRVLGTAFRIRAFPDSVAEVNVTRGRVMLFTINETTGDTAAVVLTTGTKGILPLKSMIPLLVENSTPDDLFWFDHSLEFKQTPLSQVFRLLERYYPVTIRVSNDNIYKCSLTATFADDPAERILSVIAESFGLTMTTNNQIYLLTGNGCTEGDK